MRITYALLFPAMMPCLLGAQPLPLPSGILALHAHTIQQLLSSQNSQQNKLPPTTLSLERTIGQSTTDNSLNTVTDSILVAHSPNGTSDYDYNLMFYAYNYPCNISPSFHYPDNFFSPQIKFKSRQYWTVNPNTLTYGFYQSDRAGYGPNDNLLYDTIIHADSSINPNMILSKTYNAASKLHSSFTKRFKGGLADSSSKQFLSYDLSNRLIKDSTYVYHIGKWFLVSKNLYTYGSSPNPVKIECYSRKQDTTLKLPLIIQLKYENSYDANGRLKTVQTSYHDGNVLRPYVRDTFQYAAGVNFHTSWVQYQYDPINAYWAPMSYMHKSLNALLLPDTVYTDQFDSIANKWVPMTRVLVFYNPSGNPERLEEYVYNFTAFPVSPDFTTRYYYENYSTTTGLEQVQASTEKIIAFPNPFTENITIDASHIQKEKSSHLTLKIYDAQGREVSSTSLNDDIQTIALRLAPGSYSCLLITGDKALSSTNIIAAAR